MSITIQVSGRAMKRQTSGSTSELTELKVTETIECKSVETFRKLAAKQEPASIAKHALSDTYHITNAQFDSWIIRCKGNSSDYIEFAEKTAEESELNIIELLTLWLQNIGSQRIRRALHTVLHNEHSIDVDPDAF